MEPSGDLKDLFLRWLDTFLPGNFDTSLTHLSPKDGVLVIGTDDEEWWEGYDNIYRMLNQQSAELGTPTFFARKVNAYSEGKVGWAAGRIIVKYPDGKEFPMRLTMVFHHEHGVWKIIQVHASSPVKNAGALRVSLAG